MEINNAIKILDSATGLLKLSRADHVKIQQALNTVQTFVAKTQAEANAKAETKKEDPKKENKN